jgi:hypothetical protein
MYGDTSFRSSPIAIKFDMVMPSGYFDLAYKHICEELDVLPRQLEEPCIPKFFPVFGRINLFLLRWLPTVLPTDFPVKAVIWVFVYMNKTNVP